MDASDLTLREVAVAVGYGVLGFVATAAVAIGATFGLQELLGLQRRVYHATYGWIGPSEASEFGIIVHFVLAGALAIVAAALLGEYLSDRGDNARAFGVAIGALAVLIGLLVVVSLGVEPSVLFAFVWIVAVALVVPVVLRFGYGVRSGGVPAFVGGVPFLVLLMLLAAFGLGWGGGHVVTAREVPAESVDGEVASLDGAPEFRADLFDRDDCETTVEGDRRCRLVLRGYDHEVAAVRALDRLGVRCPHRTEVQGSGSVVVRHDRSYYRLTCDSFGD